MSQVNDARQTQIIHEALFIFEKLWLLRQNHFLILQKNYNQFFAIKILSLSAKKNSRGADSATIYIAGENH